MLPKAKLFYDLSVLFSLYVSVASSTKFVVDVLVPNKTAVRARVFKDSNIDISQPGNTERSHRRSSEIRQKLLRISKCDSAELRHCLVYLFITAPGMYQATNEHLVLRVDVLEAGKMCSVRI